MKNHSLRNYNKICTIIIKILEKFHACFLETITTKQLCNCNKSFAQSVKINEKIHERERYLLFAIDQRFMEKEKYFWEW